jgi:protein-S-isoprenylcysteine O-methyltransferase Ste14
MIGAGQIIRASWIAFIVYWTVTGFQQRAVAERVPWFTQLAHKLPVGFGAWLMIFPLWDHRLWNPLLPFSQPVFPWLGAALCVIGVAGAIWARWTLAGNWNSNVVFKQGHELIERGPYRFVRHPIYTSLLVMGLGTALAENRLSGFAGVFFWFVGFWIKLRQEEKLLTRHFAAEYPAYMTRVKALIPFVL